MFLGETNQHTFATSCQANGEKTREPCIDANRVRIN